MVELGGLISQPRTTAWNAAGTGDTWGRGEMGVSGLGLKVVAGWCSESMSRVPSWLVTIAAIGASPGFQELYNLGCRARGRHLLDALAKRIKVDNLF